VKEKAGSENPSPAGDRARILLVDDDERNLLALSEVLEPVADIVRATSGRAALRKLLSEEFAVILLDVFMPDMDGYETATLIRQRAQTSRIPIIFLSAVNKETEHLMRGYAMGAVDYVFKPVDPLILRSKVSVFVDLFLLRQQVAEQAQEEQKLREEKLRVEAERLAFERELQHTQLRQATILEALPLALYEARLDDEGHLHRRFIGGDIDELAGGDAGALESGELSWEDRIVPEDRNELDRRLSASAASPVAANYRWRRSSGETIHLMEQCVRLPDDANTWVGSIIDVTAQRELEQQLIQARKMEALGQLTGGVAHDFNNLLAAVLGGLRLLKARVELEGREEQIVEQMRHAAEKGAELVRRLMAFARKQELSPAPLDPHELRNSVAALVEHSLGDGVEVEWIISDDDLHFFVDQAQLELSLVNLLVNARDAMSGGGKIRIEVEQLDHAPESTASSDGEYLAIRVSDTGEGMPPEVAAKVTEPFFTTKEAGRGTGLGLSMVAGFVEQSGGELRITSQIAEGTQIEMRLPATRDVSAAKPRALEGDPQKLGIASVLLVDDDESVRLILSEQLRDLGLEVVAAVDGKHGIALLEKDAEQFQFVLTDLSMPRMGGRELFGVIRRRWPHIKCAIMTGNPTEREIGRADCEGAMLQKPIDLAELKQLMTVL
jgi:signal transduction histidine kinase